MTRRSAPLMLVDVRYQQNNRVAAERLTRQVGYIGRMPLFDRHLAPQPLPAARWLIATHGLRPQWDGPVAFHRLLLSVRRGAGLDDPTLLKVLTGVALEDLGLLTGCRPVWVAGIHEDTDNLHAHILAAGGTVEGRSLELRGGTLAAFKRRLEERASALRRSS